MSNLVMIFGLLLLLSLAFVLGFIAARNSARMNERLTGLLSRLRRFRFGAGHIAFFVLGGLLMTVLTLKANPYTVARWVGVYQDAMLGSLVTSDQATLETGQIPQDILDWYAKSQMEQ